MKSGWMEQNCRSRRFLLFAAVMTAAVLIAVPTTSAETLNEALASAYSGNPTLRAQRANQRSTDELVPQALSGWRPTVTAQAFSGVERVNNNGVQGLFFNKTFVPGQLEITLSQPVFSGFGPHYSLKSGEANVEAGRQNLLAVEQDILSGDPGIHGCYPRPPDPDSQAAQRCRAPRAAQGRSGTFQCR